MKNDTAQGRALLKSYWPNIDLSERLGGGGGGKAQGGLATDVHRYVAVSCLNAKEQQTVCHKTNHCLFVCNPESKLG